MCLAVDELWFVFICSFVSVQGERCQDFLKLKPHFTIHPKNNKK
jgi:hypothetical protein